MSLGRLLFWKSPDLAAALIILLTIAVYWPSMHGGFVFDDETFIRDNPMVKADDGLYRFWFTTQAPDYYPLTWSLYWTEWQMWGASPMGYHVINVLLHAINAVLIWIVLKQLKIPWAWLAGLVFALHPVNVATAAWIIEQKNTLSMCFYLVTILLFLKFTESGERRWYGLSLGTFLLALLSKTAVVMLPVVLLLCIWWLYREVKWRHILWSIPFFALSLISGLVTIWFHYSHVLKLLPVQRGGFASRLAMAGSVPWFYLYKAVLPINLTLVYGNWGVSTSRWVSFAPGVILLGCFAVLIWKRRSWGRPLLFGLGYFVIMLFPVLGFLDQSFYSYSLVADHWQYYSIIGVIALVVAAGQSIWSHTAGQVRHLATTAGVVVLIVLGVATWNRGYVYASDETLWRDNIRKNPNPWLAENNLAGVLWQAGHAPEAITHWEESLRLRPDYVEAHNNLGAALWKSGKVEVAIGHYEQALRIQPDNPHSHYNLGFALAHLGRQREAIQQYELALRFKPDYPLAHCKLGMALEQIGDKQGAIAHYKEAVRIKPDYADAQNNLTRLSGAPPSLSFSP